MSSRQAHSKVSLRTLELPSRKFPECLQKRLPSDVLLAVYDSGQLGVSVARPSDAGPIRATGAGFFLDNIPVGKFLDDAIDLLERTASTEIRLDAASADLLGTGFIIGKYERCPLLRSRTTQANGILDVLGRIEEGESLVRLILVETLAAAGHDDESRAALERAYQRLYTRAENIEHPLLRASFLSCIPENARISELARRAGLCPRGSA